MKHCKQVAKMMAPPARPGLWQKIQFLFHLLICHYCRIYLKHLKILSKNYKKNIDDRTKLNQKAIQEIEDQIIKEHSK